MFSFVSMSVGPLQCLLLIFEFAVKCFVIQLFPYSLLYSSRPSLVQSVKILHIASFSTSLLLALILWLLMLHNELLPVQKTALLIEIPVLDGLISPRSLLVLFVECEPALYKDEFDLPDLLLAILFHTFYRNLFAASLHYTLFHTYPIR